MKRIYIAGPMRGVEDFNRAAFTEHAMRGKCAAKGGEMNRTPETPETPGTTGTMPQINGEPTRGGFVPSVVSVASVPSNQP